MAWVCDGIEPPASRVPRISDGTAVRREDVLKAFAELLGATLPPISTWLPVTSEVDCGPEEYSGIAKWPPVVGHEVACYVSAVNEDLNEVAGVRLPELQVPVASYTGWNPLPIPQRSLREFCGSVFPCRSTTLMPSAAVTRRTPISARHRDRVDYEAKITEVSDALCRGSFPPGHRPRRGAAKRPRRLRISTRCLGQGPPPGR